jgi:transposase-like protein
VVADTSKASLYPHIETHVEPGASVYTDTLPSYRGLAADYDHKTIDHAEAYVVGRVHTNGLENFWSLLKRGLHGTYVSVQPFHLFRYLDERVMTYNLRELDDYGRFTHVLRTAIGRRLTWSELTGRT